LLDLMLPKLNGVEILKKVRAEPQFQKTHVIVFTNAYVPNMISEAFQAGANQVLNKATITPRKILETIHAAILCQSGLSPDGSPAPPPSRKNGPGDPDQPAAPTARSASGGSSDHHSAASPAPSVASSPAGNAAMKMASGVPATPETAASEDAEFQAELVQAFLENTPDTLIILRRTIQELSKTQEETERQEHLSQLYRRVHTLTGNAGLAGLHNVSQMAAALEVLLRELGDKPETITASTLRTVSHAIDLLGELFQSRTEGDLMASQPVNVLVADDEILSRQAVTYALEKAALQSVSVADPQMALNLATEKPFDLIILDVLMPGLDGFELCTKIRALPTNKATPLIFVTSLTDLQARARSSLSGGTDFIVKPFMFIELSVKALTYVLRSRLAQRKMF